MHQMVSANLATSRRWWVLAIVVAAQFMFGVDAFIVNVAIPTIAAELHATAAEIESVIAIYLVAYSTLIVTGGLWLALWRTRWRLARLASQPANRRAAGEIGRDDSHVPSA